MGKTATVSIIKHLLKIFVTTTTNVMLIIKIHSNASQTSMSIYTDGGTCDIYTMCRWEIWVMYSK